MLPLPNNPRSIVALLYDAAMMVAAWLMSYSLRFNFDIAQEYQSGMWQNLIWILPLQISVFIYFGLYQGVWRFASIPDLKRILKAILVATLLLGLIQLMHAPYGMIPRSVVVLNPILLMVMMSGSRLAYRVWKEYHLYGDIVKRGQPVLILGAGDVAVSLVKELARTEEWNVVGMLDDDMEIHGRLIMGVKVLGSIANVASVASDYQVSHTIVAIPNSKISQRRHAVELANLAGLTVLTVPGFDDLLSGKLTISQIRRIDVEDLLGRESVSLDSQGLHGLIEGRSVVVTGAGGSIGSELCRQIALFSPSTLVCLDISEYALYQLEQEFAKVSAPNTEVIYLTADIRNYNKIKNIISKYAPRVIFHAAAYKHVPLMENRNVAEALANNVGGTYSLAQACIKGGVDKFVLISTDKAVNPTNVMGASKRLAEMVCQGLQEDILTNPTTTKFVMVRFGNVLGSSGSVIPKFREQIAKGGPVTVTHPEITRFFMSIPEAAQLVMQAGLMGKGGEIFVLDMGESIKIAELARNMIRLSGLSEDDIEIRYTGLRPGEKLYEELLADDESTLKTPHEKLRIAKARSVDSNWVEALIKWIQHDLPIDESRIKEELKTWVTEYVGDVNASLQVDKNALMPENYTSGSPSIH